MLRLFGRHLFTTLGAGGDRFGLLSLLGQQFAHDDLSDPVDFLDRLFFDRHQVGIGEIGDPAPLNEPIDHKISDFFSGWSIRCRFHGKFPVMSHPKFPAFPAVRFRV